MPIKFSPNYIITPRIAQSIVKIEAAKERVLHLPATPSVLASLRESARLYSTHYSTMIEGNRLNPAEIKEILENKGHFPGKERDEKEVKGYYAALNYAEQISARGSSLTEKVIQTLHALVIADGKKTIIPTPYREGQNIIKDGRTGRIIYMPPEAKDVQNLMNGMITWINTTTGLPFPLVAAITHYQFATIHPYCDGNGRTARLLTTLILYKNGYDLKGLYSLEEYYARNLDAYYEAISIGESHNYYLGRAEADITKWIEYFTEGMATSFETVLAHMSTTSSLHRSFNEGEGKVMRTLDPQQRRALTLFLMSEIITAKQVCELFGFQPRTGSQICKKWVEGGFLEILNPANKSRTYKLAEKYECLIQPN